MPSQEPAKNIIESNNESLLPSFKKIFMFGVGAALGATTLLLYRKLYARQPLDIMQEIVLEDKQPEIPLIS